MSVHRIPLRQIRCLIRYIHCSVVFDRGVLRREEAWDVSCCGCDLVPDTNGAGVSLLEHRRPSSVTVFPLVCVCLPLGDSGDAFVWLG